MRHALHPSLPTALVDRLKEHDAYDGSVSHDVHARVLTESWRRFGESRPAAARSRCGSACCSRTPAAHSSRGPTNPRGSSPRHVSGLVEAVQSHAPALVYLDAGDPRPVLERAAAERPAEWLEAVVDYHTGQGLGLRLGLRGFDGYVDFMRHRRDVELEVIESLDLPTLVVPVDADAADRSDRDEQVRTFLAEHLGLDGRPEPSQVA